MDSSPTVAAADTAVKPATTGERDLHRKIRRTEGESLGVRAAAGGLVRRCAPNGAASHPTFCPSDLPVKISQGLATRGLDGDGPRRAGERDFLQEHQKD